jgi:hypothetical protein
LYARKVLFVDFCFKLPRKTTVTKLFLISSVLLLALTGCGGSGSDESAPPANAPSPSSAPSSIESSLSSNDAMDSSSSSIASSSSSSSSSSSVSSSSAGTVSQPSSSSSSIASSSISSVSSIASSSSENSSQSSSEEPPPTLLTVQKIIFAAFNAAGQATPLRELHHGDTLDLAEMPEDKVNILVETDLPGETGSVHFLLQGPIAIDRWENDAAYTLAATPSHFSIAAQQFPIGDYTLTVIAYTQADKQGEAGVPTTLSFNVINSTPSPVPPPVSWGGGNEGFTPITPSSDSRLIYVSDSQGSDSNDCFGPVSPCKTIVAGRNKMREGFPDHLYLKRGDVWRHQILDRFPSGRSLSEPAVIAFYGESGPRPKLENISASTIGRDEVRFIHIIGLEFSAYQLDSAHPEFTGSGSANIVMIANHRDLLFEDNRFNYVEVVSHKFTNNQGVTSVPRNITLRRNIWTGYYFNESSYQRDKRPSNIYAGVWDNFALIENVFDHGGWHAAIKGAGANMYNHNIYLQEGVTTNTLIKGNIITRGSSHGIQMRSGGLAEDNFFGRNTNSLSIGYQQPLLAPGTQAHVINNVVSEGVSMVKGVDPCQNNNVANLCSRALWGIDMDTRGGDADWVATDNIISRLGPNDNQWRSMIDTRYDATWEERYQLSVVSFNRWDAAAVAAGNNIVWKWSLNPAEPSHHYPDPERTLADYNAHLGGTQSFEAFMDVVLERPLQTWDERYTAYGINNYIRAGFGR